MGVAIKERRGKSELLNPMEGPFIPRGVPTSIQRKRAFETEPADEGIRRCRFRNLQAESTKREKDAA